MTDDLAHDMSQAEHEERERWLALTSAERHTEIARICALYGAPFRTDAGVAEEVSKYLALVPGLDQKETNGDGRVEPVRAAADAGGHGAGSAPPEWAAEWIALLRDKGLTALSDGGGEIVALSHGQDEGGTVPDYELSPNGSMQEITMDDVTGAIVQLAGMHEALADQVASSRDQEFGAATAALADLARASMSPDDAGDLVAGRDRRRPERVPAGDVLAARFRGTGRDDVYKAIRGLALAWAMPQYAVREMLESHAESHFGLSASSGEDWALMAAAADLGMDLSTLHGFGDLVGASGLLEQSDAVALMGVGQMAGTNWSLGVGGTLELAAAREPGTYYGSEAESGHHAPTAHLSSEAEVMRLTALAAAENHVPLAAVVDMHDGHDHYHRHDGDETWHDGHGPGLNEIGEHSHEHQHDGVHAHGHSAADLQQARNPGSDIRRLPADVAPREPQVPPSSPWAQPGRVGDWAQREVDRITTQHAAEFHGGVNKTVTSRTRAHVDDEDPRDYRQPRRPDRVHPAYLETLDPRVQAIVRVDPYGLFSTGTRFGRSAPPGPVGQRDVDIARQRRRTARSRVAARPSVPPGR